MQAKFVISTVAGFLMTASIDASQLNFSGYTAVEGRLFTQSPTLEGQDSDTPFSYVAEPEIRLQSSDRAHQLTLIPFLRIDSEDKHRTHADLREAYWRHTFNSWELLFGVNKMFWGVAESRHLVDIINQTDSIEDIDEEDKLGQPMLLLGLQRDWGEVQLIFMPYFRERTFPGKNGRLRTPLPVDDDQADYESSAEEYHVDIAARYSHYIGDWDIGASYFYGTGREPLLRPHEDGTRLIAFYEIIHQASIDAQYTHEAWLWKFEGIAREGQGDLFAAAVGGFEFTHYQILDSSMDVGHLLEYNYDGRDETKAPRTVFDNDVFVGSRLVLNDVQDTQVLAGASIDTKTGATFLSAEAERRLGDGWKIELEGRFFTHIDETDPASAFERDDFINVSLQRHF